MVGPVVHPHPRQGGHSQLLPLENGGTPVDQRENHVIQRVQVLEQVVALENEADLPVADAGQVLVLQGGDIGPIQLILPMGGHVQTAQHVHHGGLARTGRTHDGHKFPPVDLEGHAIQRPDLALLSLVINFVKVFDVNEHGATSADHHAAAHAVLLGGIVDEYHVARFHAGLDLHLLGVGDSGLHQHGPVPLLRLGHAV